MNKTKIIGIGIIVFFVWLAYEFPYRWDGSTDNFYSNFEFIGLKDQYHVKETTKFTINQIGYGILCGQWDAWIEKDGRKFKELITLTTSCQSDSQPHNFETDFFFNDRGPFLVELNDVGNYTVFAKHSEYGPTSIGERNFIVIEN